MQKQPSFEEWKSYRKRVSIPGDFSDRVMSEIRDKAIEKPVFSIDRLILGSSSASRLTRSILALGLSVTGVFRISYVVLKLLTP